MDGLLLPEIWIQILSELEMSTIKILCNASTYIQNLCKISYVRKLLANVYYNDIFNTSNLSEDQFYNKVKPLKMRMIKNNILNVLCHNIRFTLSKGILSSTTCDIPLDNEYFNIYKNISYFRDLFCENKSSGVKSRVINISQDYSVVQNTTYIITHKKEYYICTSNTFRINMYQIIIPLNIVQLNKNFCLSDTGEIYAVDFDDSKGPDFIIGQQWKVVTDILIFDKLLYFYKINFYQKIISFSKTLYSANLLLENGNVCEINQILGLKTFNSKDIIQIFDGDYFLDNKGNIYYNDVLKIKTNKNIIEICVSCMIIYALDDEMNIFVYYGQKIIKSLDLLNL